MAGRQRSRIWVDGETGEVWGDDVEACLKVKIHYIPKLERWVARSWPPGCTIITFPNWDLLVPLGVAGDTGEKTKGDRHGEVRQVLGVA